MSEPPTGGATRAETPPPDPKNAATGQLIGDLTDPAPPLPAETVAGVQEDIATVKQGSSR